MFQNPIDATCANASFARSRQFGEGLEVPWHTSLNYGLADGVDEEELCEEPGPDDGMFKALISNTCGHCELRLVLCVAVDVVFVATFDATLRLFYGIRV